ncbi:dipeptidase [Ramlibacter rhizophilus]|uniref:Dipeptidase n=1 Tax=Ramlibacter rhizophilus TaxID=1781167 RepID=A0A4Z0BH43_9BURK|nr:membrane dipeptidase [Ramlibacter rhizophilus]TFY98625.1 dipeptidase [Ramlibacter rhizophilus]
MNELTIRPEGVDFAGRTYAIVDGLSMPTPERRWFEQYRGAPLAAVNITISVWENASETMALLGKWRQVLAANQDLVAQATSVEDIEAIRQSGRTALVFGFQNTAPVEHNLDLFGVFRDLGVCIMQLTYNLQNYIGCGYWEEKDTGISSRFGRKALEEMNRLGILIDLSHCGERTTLEAIELSAVPVAITHANPREFVGKGVYGSSRQKTTEAIKALAARKGVIGLSPNRNMTQFGAATTLEQFGDMVAWVADLVGVDAIGLGSDYCPGHTGAVRTWWRYARWSRESAPAEQMTMAPHEGWSDWVKTPAGLHNLIPELDRRGFSLGEIDQMMGGNWMRLFAQTFVPRPGGAA